MNRYDYIIAGAGAAGLSLIVKMIVSGKFNDKTILLIDQAPKTRDDRTWCFWEEHPGIFEPVVHRRWTSMWFHGPEGESKLHDIFPYSYKMIRSIDFYKFCFNLIGDQSNIFVKYGVVESIHSDEKETYAVVAGQKLYTQYIFSSIAPNSKRDEKSYFLWQHFKGWFIEAESDVFDPAEATLMDFRVNQYSDTRFVYVMPLSKRQALVEYTGFSEKRLNDDEYNENLAQYCESILQLKSDEFEILSEEFGMIPMTNHMYPSAHHNIIYIGSAGGQTKGSSGYTFRFIQKHSQRIVEELIKNDSPHIRVEGSKFNFYDSVLLKILKERRLPGALIFARLFEQNEMRNVFKFLDNETSIGEDIKLIGSLPKRKFIGAAFSHLFH